MRQITEKYKSDALSMFGVLVLGFFWAFALRGQQSEGKQESKPLPRFEEFSVVEVRKGSPVPPIP